MIMAGGRAVILRRNVFDSSMTGLWENRSLRVPPKSISFTFGSLAAADYQFELGRVVSHEQHYPGQGDQVELVPDQGCALAKPEESKIIIPQHFTNRIGFLWVSVVICSVSVDIDFIEYSLRSWCRFLRCRGRGVEKAHQL